MHHEPFREPESAVGTQDRDRDNVPLGLLALRRVIVPKRVASDRAVSGVCLRVAVDTLIATGRSGAEGLKPSDETLERRRRPHEGMCSHSCENVADDAALVFRDVGQLWA